MKLLAITDRAQLKTSLGAFLERCVAAGVDAVQIREKDLTGKDLYALAREAHRVASDGGTQMLLNDRLDVALAANLDGVHVRSSGPGVERVRSEAPPGFRVGVSCHSVEEVLRAEREGADYTVLGPVFPTPSKVRFGVPLGLDLLRDACARSLIDVFALGGVDRSNAAECLKAGAAGLAGIRLFQDADDLRATVEELRACA